eukprot:Blabericola_migrator_1__5411@NODE_2770_length_2372_cov_65_206074_g1734_i0_p2_GENE_NODE_2770_length_2372_cov_65_206074_g1734_i0NODE_2770_length_2372_cov_65_206074_g1734_i0_p2_ORF_typecomplete_len176_score45_45DUF3417/PF11897_8/0_16NfI_DNAbd_preN/PF10524_9/0_19Cytochrom_C_2/PF01322_20/0_26_NODE_2770_length_2372_cov_65_206074_g1734_i0346873
MWICWLLLTVRADGIVTRSLPNLPLPQIDDVTGSLDVKWSPMTRALLNLQDEDEWEKCATPDEAFVVDLSNELTEANSKFQLSKRLKGVLGDMLQKQEPLDNEALRTKLETTFDLLNRVCQDYFHRQSNFPHVRANATTWEHLQKSGRFPVWDDTDPETLKLQLMQFTFNELSRQ